jgi:hypothetical protein
MAMKIMHDAGKPTASVELTITRPLPDYDLNEVEAPIPRDVDPMLASQGFKDLLDEARGILQAELAGTALKIVQLTGAISHDQNLYRPGIWLVLREEGAAKEMSPAARQSVSNLAEKLHHTLGLA